MEKELFYQTPRVISVENLACEISAYQSPFTEDGDDETPLF